MREGRCRRGRNSGSEAAKPTPQRPASRKGAGLEMHQVRYGLASGDLDGSWPLPPGAGAVVQSGGGEAGRGTFGGSTQHLHG